MNFLEMSKQLFNVYGKSIQASMEQVRCRGESSLVLKTEHFVCISKGKDVFLRLPTDFGKYICYEVLPFVLDSAAFELSCLRQLHHVRTRPVVKTSYV